MMIRYVLAALLVLALTAPPAQAQTISTVRGGGLMLISTQTGGSGSTLSWTGLGTTYNKYLLSCSNIYSTTDSDTLSLRFGQGPTPTYLTSGYINAFSFNYNGGAATTDSASDVVIMFQAVGLGGGSSGEADIWLDLAAGGYPKANGSASATRGGFIYQGRIGGTYVTDTTAITAVRLLVAGTTLSGQCSLYGVAGS